MSFASTGGLQFYLLGRSKTAAHLTNMGSVSFAREALIGFSLTAYFAVMTLRLFLMLFHPLRYGYVPATRQGFLFSQKLLHQPQRKLFIPIVLDVIAVGDAKRKLFITVRCSNDPILPVSKAIFQLERQQTRRTAQLSIPRQQPDSHAVHRQ